MPRRLRSERRAAEHLFGRTGARFRPQLTAILEERGKKSLAATKRLADLTRVTVSAADPAEGSSPSEFQLEVFLPVFRTQALEQATASYNWEATRLRNRQGLEDYKLDVARRFYDLLRSHSVVAIRRRQVERWDANLELARFRADIGVRSKLDFWNTKVNRAQSVTALIQAELSEKSAADRLANLLGIPFEGMQPAEEELQFTRFEPAAAADWRRADLAARGFERRLAAEALQAARRNARPDLALSLSSTKLEGATRDDAAKLTYNFPIGRNAEWYDLAISRQALVQAELVVESLAADIEAEQREVLRDLDAIARNVQVATESLELARLSYEASRIQFEAGRITQIELQRSQDNLTDAERTYEGFLIDYQLAGHRWRRAFGGELFP